MTCFIPSVNLVKLKDSNDHCGLAIDIRDPADGGLAKFQYGGGVQIIKLLAVALQLFINLVIQRLILYREIINYCLFIVNHLLIKYLQTIP